MIKEVYEVIESFNIYISNIPAGSIQIAEHLRKDEVADAMQLILQFSEGMGWLVQASELLNENGLEVLFEVEKIHEFLNEVNDGLEIQDYVLVADMFEYEIAPFFEQAPPIKGIEQ